MMAMTTSLRSRRFWESSTLLILALRGLSGTSNLSCNLRISRWLIEVFCSYKTKSNSNSSWEDMPIRWCQLHVWRTLILLPFTLVVVFRIMRTWPCWIAIWGLYLTRTLAWIQLLLICFISSSLLGSKQVSRQHTYSRQLLSKLNCMDRVTLIHCINNARQLHWLRCRACKMRSVRLAVHPQWMLMVHRIIRLLQCSNINSCHTHNRWAKQSFNVPDTSRRCRPKHRLEFTTFLDKELEVICQAVQVQCRRTPPLYRIRRGPVRWVKRQADRGTRFQEQC